MHTKIKISKYSGFNGKIITATGFSMYYLQLKEGEYQLDVYEYKILSEIRRWMKKMTRESTRIDRIAKRIQTRTSKLIPDTAHDIMTGAIKNMMLAVLTGSEFTTREPIKDITLEEREKIAKEKLAVYRRTASLEGAGTGAGGILLGLADFPLLLSIKIKFLFELASVYGFDVKDLRERLFILYLFQLAFSSREKRLETYEKVINWDDYIDRHPISLETIDWRVWQQEYRDYIDLAKLLQLVPGIGAFVGAYANYRLLDELADTAINGYRLRRLKDKTLF